MRFDIIFDKDKLPEEIANWYLLSQFMKMMNVEDITLSIEATPFLPIQIKAKERNEEADNNDEYTLGLTKKKKNPRNARKAKTTEEFRLRVIAENMNGASFDELAAKHDIRKESIYLWKTKLASKLSKVYHYKCRDCGLPFKSNLETSEVRCEDTACSSGNLMVEREHYMVPGG